MIGDVGIVQGERESGKPGEMNVLDPKSRAVGENTFVTAVSGCVHPGGGSFFAAAQAVTISVNHRQSHFPNNTSNGTQEHIHEASASPPVTTATFASPLAILFAASSTNFAGWFPPCSL